MKYLILAFVFFGIVGCQPTPPVVINQPAEQRPVVIDRRPNIVVAPGPWYYPYHRHPHFAPPSWYRPSVPHPHHHHR